MTIIATDDILRIVRTAPAHGLTTVEVADLLAEEGTRAPTATVSARLSKLAMYGRIDKDLECALPHQRGGPHKFYRWKPREGARA